LVVTFCLDTNVIVELLRGGRESVRKRFGEARAEERPLTTSLIVLHELLFGAENGPRPEVDRTAVSRILADIAVEPLDEADITMAAHARVRLRRLGKQIGSYDLLIAGQALARDWTLITANTREFARVEGLKVIDWTAP